MGNRGLSPNIPGQVADNALIANAQGWLDQVKADLNLAEGEVTMFVLDLPNVPPQDAPVMIAQANQAQSSGTTKTRTLGVCSPKPNRNYSLENVVIPVISAGYYLEAYENRTPPSGTTTILQPPVHGVLRLVTEADRGTLFDSSSDALDPNQPGYAYLPDSNYVGNDTATIQVDFGNGLKVNVRYFFQVVNRGGLGDDWVGTYCRKTGPFWKISSTLDPDGTIAATSVEYQLLAATTTAPSSTTDILGSWLSLAQQDGKLAEMSGLLTVLNVGATTNGGITFAAADLAASTLGQTTGSSMEKMGTDHGFPPESELERRGREKSVVAVRHMKG